MTAEHADDGLCGRPSSRPKRPCRNSRSRRGAACYAHMTKAERLAQQEAIAAITAADAAERRGPHRQALIEYVQWRNTLPDLSGLPEVQAWRAFAKAHGGRCALCRVPDGDKMVDHDHTTGLVRGLLCRGCNGKALSGIPHLALSRYTDISPALALYCQWPPSSVAGLRVRYHGPFVDDPATELHKVLWHAGPDGLEHEPTRRLAWNVTLSAALVAELPLGDVLAHLRATHAAPARQAGHA